MDYSETYGKNDNNMISEELKKCEIFLGGQKNKARCHKKSKLKRKI